MFTLEIDKDQVKRLVESAHKAKKQFRKELAGAINQVAKKTRLEMGRKIRETIVIKKDESEQPISVRASATTDNLTAVVSLRKTPRLGLRHFGARQNKKGVTYKISKSGGRKLAEGAFMGPKPGAVRMKWKGNAFKRTGKGRLPIVQIKGPSPFGVFTKNNMEGPQAATVAANLRHEIERRIKLNVLRASGLVKT